MSSNQHLHPEGAAQLPETAKNTFHNSKDQIDNMELKAIAELAYMMWEKRGRPLGSSQEDWFRAEHDLRRSREWSLPNESSGIGPSASEV
jgi:Protein of unknown function (DUF2934)